MQFLFSEQVLERIPSIRTISQTLATSAGIFLGSDAANLDNCPSNTPLSCHNSSAITNTCCTNVPGGLVLQTQFWDYNPAIGPANHWTLHGLWPDNCDGTYQQYCDSSRNYSNITQILQAQNQTELLNYMSEYWKDYQGNDESLWSHEFGKHGTCFSSLDPKCYKDYTPQQEVGQYFKQAVALFEKLDSYTFLKDAGIVPSNDATYALSDVQAALTKAHGFEVTVQCDRHGAFDEIWYYYNVLGPIYGGKYVPTSATTSGNCPRRIRYPIKGRGVTTTSTSMTKTATTSSSTSHPTSGPFSGKGHLNVVQSSGSTNGCLITYGTWYRSGTCASYTAKPVDNGFTLASTKGPCVISSSSNALSCSSGVVNPTVFQSDGSTLRYNASDAFHAKAVPAGFKQQAIYSGSGAVDLTIVWQSI